MAALLFTSVPSPADQGSGQDMGRKLGSAASNLVMGWVELPKNMIITTNQTNVAFGLTGGMLKGGLHTMARTVCGLIDLLTFPLPIKPIVQPTFVWENFGAETSYGPVFQSERR